ncbi:vacuolar protein sorting-associated protein 16 homolog [Mercenaria mercenaria]|uniref:vacuolar protein sorting-associated protein 16 homolog n=1 Tax=Mercenaria mercenaria TaxID=6596 RepID=UPI00234F96BC|nr:vacuolar protein sorting-associated protein 16 homolog [Mercenaria mercenaria]
MASANWLPLGHVYYEKLELYSLEWGDQIDLSKFIVAAAPYGGPVALLRDDSNNPNISASVKPIIHVFTSSGRPIAQLRWTSGRIKKLGWSTTEDLLCVQDDGVVLVYDIFLNFKRQFGLGQEAKDTKVLDVRIFRSYKGTGIAVLTCSYRIFMVNCIDDLRVRRLAEVPGLNSSPTAWGIITMDGQSQALVAKQNELYLVDHGGQYQQQTIDVSVPAEAIMDMAISFNNKYLALFTESGIVWIGSADLKKKYCEFNTKSHQRPSQFIWSGPGAVVALWEKLMLVIGPDKDYISFQNDSAVSLVEEEDGVRIVGRDNVEFFRKVPLVTEQIFKIASMEPGAMLFEASREFERESQRADEYIRTIKDNLDVAVSQCIQAAGHEIEPSKQRALLKAASFGKCFLTDYNPEPFFNMCQMLRILNQVRNPSIGIPLTYSQLEHLTMPVLIDRLVLRKYFYLAIRICQYLKLPESEGASRILAHWACYKVLQKTEDDEQVAYAIRDKMGDTPGVSYSDIASKALECGRTDLAIRLLDYEPKAARQVPLLLQMKKEQIALSKAIDSGDTDLIYFVLMRLKDTMPQGEFFMAIRNIPVALSLFLQYCRQQNPELMEQLFYQEDNFQDEATCQVQKSFKQERLEDRLQVLNNAKESYTKARNEFAAKQVDDEIKLLKYQRRLEEELHRPYMDLSLHQTVHKLIVDNSNKMAEQLRKEFKIPEKRYWWLRIDALAEAGEWMELDKFSKTKKPQLGMEAFVEVCLKYGNKREAMKYIPRVVPDKKVQCLIKMGDLRLAAEAAFENRNEDDLNRVLRKCTLADRAVEDQIKGYKQQLAGGRR